MNKKGIFFTILVIALLSLFVITFGAYAIIKNRDSINTRIDTMNNFVLLVEQDLPRKTYISGFRIIFLLQNRVIKNATYIDNVEERFQECFFNGTIYEQIQEENMTKGIIFSDIVQDINKKAKTLNINVSFYNPQINISQEDPWHVRVNFTTILLIEDLGKLALWNRTFSAIADVPIENFEDPLYIVETKKVFNSINKTPYTVFVDGSNTENLSLHAEYSYYKASVTAPSFLDRFEGRFDPDPNGIESMVNRQKLENQGIPTSSKSVIDYIYFNESDNPVPVYGVVGMYSPLFKIADVDGHFDNYSISCGVTIPAC